MKIDLFEYFVKELITWFCEYYGIRVDEFNNHPKNDLSKLKVIKLHFFACSTDHRALDIFNRFYAMPFGHVESDVYDNIDNLKHFIISDDNTIQTSSTQDILGDPMRNEIIINMVRNLKERNNDLIAAKAFDLVDISHRWFSWEYTFSEARKLESYSKEISPSLIKQELKYYTY
ncbi:hypothetical protein [Pedobacter nototheniae]|uniref:hypothetical protein n=1 Tax=Pedobacter nototheniae TaxID=2488994 RepID=UPI001039E4D6|nr:hypothetical protein [Pedobacter nototheniae]